VSKPNPIPNSKPWKPGYAPYSEWLKNLTPAEKEAHLKKRREKKAMRQVMKEVVEEYQTQWAAEMHNAAWAVLMKARNEGDAQAFATVFDRIIGRPTEVKPDDGRALPWSDQDI
jgi:lysyl-tRNA synthetase class I